MHKLKSAQSRVALPLWASTLLSIISYSSQEASFIPLFSSAMLAVRHWTLVPEEDKGVHKHCLEDPLNLRVLRIEAFKEANKS